MRTPRSGPSAELRAAFMRPACHAVGSARMPAVSSWPYKKIVAVTFVVSVFMDVLDVTIVNVALKTIRESFGASETGLEWVVTGYILSLAIWIPASGWLGDRIGTKRVFLFALGMFTFGS